MSIHTSLYDVLLENESIPKNRLDQAVSMADEQGITLIQTLLEQDFITEEDLLIFLSEYTSIPFEHIDKATVDYRMGMLIPESFAREHFVLPLFRLGDTLSVAISNPFDIQTIEEVELMTGLDINPILTVKSNMEALFNYCYSYQEANVDEDATSMSSLFEMGLKLVEDKNLEEDILDLAQEAPIAKLVDTIIKQAITEKASDIHIEPEEDTVKVRFRIDGLLKDIMSPPKKLEAPMISRIKILANLDITETRKPQDGRITISLKDKDIDFRVSTIRTILGEKVVLRVLDKSGAFVSMEKLGFSDSNYKQVSSLISATSGIIIVCGPTGSGKTSTLYSALSKINTEDKNIITIEDPVEYNLDGINQIQINARANVDFVTGLTAIVRQDPDVIMVGEIRDLETASIATQAALTGHLVFSTLHTRNAAGTVTRLIDMGIQPFLLNSSINGIIGQRLVRTICPNCKRTSDPKKYTDFKQKELIDSLKEMAKENFKIFQGDGCKFCDHTGYKGRTGIFEILVMTESIRDLIVNKASSEKIHEAAIKEGMMPMKTDGLNKVLAGITSVDEIARVLDL